MGERRRAVREGGRQEGVDSESCGWEGEERKQSQVCAPVRFTEGEGREGS